MFANVPDIYSVGYLVNLLTFGLFTAARAAGGSGRPAKPVEISWSVCAAGRLRRRRSAAEGLHGASPNDGTNCRSAQKHITRKRKKSNFRTT